MSHHVYNTQGFILSARPVREADKLFSVLTPDLGLIFGTARGVRHERSRLRGILLDLALVDVSLVRGKGSWRITTAALVEDEARLLRKEKAKLRTLAQVAALVERLVKGEEKHPEPFRTLARATRELKTTTNVALWEVQTVAKLLHELGYLSSEDLHLEPKLLIKAINEGLRESGLS